MMDVPDARTKCPGRPGQCKVDYFGIHDGKRKEKLSEKCTEAHTTLQPLTLQVRAASCICVQATTTTHNTHIQFCALTVTSAGCLHSSTTCFQVLDNNQYQRLRNIISNYEYRLYFYVFVLCTLYLTIPIKQPALLPRLDNDYLHEYRKIKRKSKLRFTTLPQG